MIGLKIVFMPEKEEQFLQRINTKQTEAFRELFSEFYNSLVLFAMGFVEQQDVAEDIVQEVFIAVWERDARYPTYNAFRSFLYNSVKNASLNHLKHKNVEAAAKNAPQSAYPKCLLCKENEGYAGRVNHPARQNHRVIPVTIDGGQWGLQYSPYVYYNEHCILFNSDHTPMKIDESAFRKLLDFVRQFPHYFVGSNADLPIVGGSILAHEHFQGGHYEFAMERAEIKQTLTIPGFEDVQAGIVNWPMSVVRIRHKEAERLVKLAAHILTAWRAYTDEDAFIYAQTDGEPHNTITPIARMRNGEFELDLVLRNNITTPEYPLGVYHPHQELHHIKKENIGLIEVMGLAVLPARLKGEMQRLGEYIISGKDIRADEELAKHADWVDEFLPKYDAITEDNVDEILQTEIGIVFKKVLEHAGVYKNTDEGMNAFMRFIQSL